MKPIILVPGGQSYWDRHGARAFWLNAFELLFSGGDYNYGLGENIENASFR
jgi:hypothetical protein